MDIEVTFILKNSRCWLGYGNSLNSFQSRNFDVLEVKASIVKYLFLIKTVFVWLLGNRKRFVKSLSQILKIEMMKPEDSFSFPVLSLKPRKYMNYWVKKKKSHHSFIYSSVQAYNQYLLNT